jgi:TPR repeat protein
MREIIPDRQKPVYLRRWSILAVVAGLVVLAAASTFYLFNDKPLQEMVSPVDLKFQSFDPKGMSKEELLRRAEVGNTFAQVFVAEHCKHGTGGFSKDPVRYFEWAHKAALAGNVWGKVESGVCFFYGTGTVKDHFSALAMFVGPARDSNDAVAQCYMGYLNSGSYGFERNDSIAFEWFRKSAAQGYAYGTAGYGRCLLLGLGVPKNAKEGVRQLRIGLNGGAVGAACLLGWAHATGEGVDKDLKEAIRFYRLAVSTGDHEGARYLAGHYLNGEGVIKDDEEAAKLFKVASDAGDIKAKKSLGNLCHYGKGVLQDSAHASKLYLEVAISGDVECQRVMGSRYQQGLGVPSDYVEAYAWYNVCAASGDELAAKSRESLAQNLQADQVTAAQKRSRELLAEIEAKKAKK